MRILYTLTFLLFFLGLSGQISIVPNSLALTISEEGDYLYTLTVANAGSNPATVWWKLAKGSNFPSAWTTQTCDNNTCYAPNFDECPPNKSNIIPANGTSTFTIHFYPNGAVGTAKLAMQLFSDKSFKNMVAETDPEANVVADKTVGTKFASQGADLKIFPNPADDYFVIKNDNNVAKVGIFNIVGKEVRSYKHNPGNTYEIDDLSRGIYIVRMLDARGKTIKSIRLSKK
jgi:hypothetical protein